MISKPLTTARSKTKGVIEKTYVFRPESLLRFLWEIFMLLLVLYLGISLPYILAFQENDPMPVFIEYIITGLYFIDICINLNTAVYIRGILRLNHKLIIREYLKFWFWVDLVSALPIDMIIELSSSNLNYLKTVRLIKFIRVFKLIKLVKLGKLKYTIAKIEDRISSKNLITLILILKLQIYIFMIAHILGCMMISISRENFKPNSFINLITNKSNDLITNNSEIYISTIYWAYTTMVSIGYGDFSPQTTEERIFGIICMFMSSITFGIIIGNIGSIIEKNSQFEKMRRETILSVNNYLKQNNVEKSLWRKVRMYIEYTLSESKQEEIDLYDLLEVLSEPLREEIYLNLNGAELFSCNIFMNFPLVFGHKLSRMMHSEVYAPYDDIIFEGSPPVGIYFIQTGSVEIYDRKSRAGIQELKFNNYFGEIGLFTRKHCCASVRSKEYSEVLTITCEDFDAVLNILPSAKLVFDEIKRSTIGGDLSVLGVYCYLCKELGHVAKKCTMIQRIRDFNREDWLNMKNRSKKIGRINMNRFSRYKAMPKDEDYGMKNVKGIKVPLYVLYGKKPSLVSACKNFLFKKEDKTTCNTPMGEFFNRTTKYYTSALSNIVDDSEEEEEVDNLDITDFDMM
ncbi:hypothetical protein SteCoe_31288 [Stentor coeruleus]|uniref:Cyclic nucleotide-binding domain-containing protein n=1 Tax=Stentor coeruleus TaxID=5963 RepID=A0A1R2B1Q8_9CILI|nr:hypothetical protein SteCoe_31288 [Stentor coeruleus]